MERKIKLLDPKKGVRKWMERFLTAFMASAIPFMVVAVFIDEQSKIYPMIEEIMSPMLWYLVTQSSATLLVVFVLHLVLGHLTVIETKNAQQVEESIHPGEAL